MFVRRPIRGRLAQACLPQPTYTAVCGVAGAIEGSVYFAPVRLPRCGAVKGASRYKGNKAWPGPGFPTCIPITRGFAPQPGSRHPSGGRLLPWPGVDTRSPGEIRRAACLLSGLAPRAGGWRRRKSPHVGTSPRDTVAAGVACPLYPHEKAGGGLRLFSTFSQVISRIRRAAGTSLPLAFIVSLPLRVATGIAPISRWRLTL